MSDRRSLHLEWNWLRQAMHAALLLEQFLSPTQLHAIGVFGIGAAIYRDRAAAIEDEMKRCGWWEGDWPA